MSPPAASAVWDMGDTQLSQAEGGNGGEILAAEQDGATPDGLDMRNRLEQRRLPGTVGAQHSDDVALAQFQRHALEGLHCAIVDDKVLDSQHGTHVSLPPCQDKPR